MINKEYPVNTGKLDMSYNKAFKPERYNDCRIDEIEFDYVCPDDKTIKHKKISMTELIQSSYDLQHESAEYYAQHAFSDDEFIEQINELKGKEDDKNNTNKSVTIDVTNGDRAVETKKEEEVKK